MNAYELTVDGSPTGRVHDFGNMTPPDFTGHPTKSGWRWLPVVRNQVTPKVNEVPGETEKTIQGDRVVYTRTVRRKTAEELAAEARSARDLHAEIDALKARIATLEGR